MRFAILLIALAVSGCATTAPRPADVLVPLETLDDVNGALAGAAALTIVLTDGSVIRGPRSVTVSASDLRYVAGGQPVALPIERVASVVSLAPRRAGRGAAVGAVPGIALLGLVGLGAAFGETDGVAGALALVFLGYTAAGVTLGGAVTGAVVGSRVGAGPDRVLYQGPVERYLTPSSQPESTL